MYLGYRYIGQGRVFFAPLGPADGDRLLVDRGGGNLLGLTLAPVGLGVSPDASAGRLRAREPTRTLVRHRQPGSQPAAG